MLSTWIKLSFVPKALAVYASLIFHPQRNCDAIAEALSKIAAHIHALTSAR